MSNNRFLFFTLCGLLLLVSGCGIIIGQTMVMGGGVKRADVVKGDVTTLRRGAVVAVLAPFDVTGKAFHIARGDDAVRFATEFERFGTFTPLYHFSADPNKQPKLLAELREMDAADIQKALGLDQPPEYLLYGTILHRETVVAPMHGVVMEASYRLEWFDVSDKGSVVLEVEVDDLFRNAVPLLAEAIDAMIK